MKKVVICASAVFYNEAQDWKTKLEQRGYEVIRTIQKIDGSNLEQYRSTHSEHYAKMADCDIICVLNLEKHGKDGYIGPSVFAEIAFAIGLNISLSKQIEIYCLNPWPNDLPYSEELDKWQKLGWVRYWPIQELV